MYRYIIASSLIVSVPSLSYAECPCQRVHESFTTRLKARLAELHADEQIVHALFTSGIVNEKGEDQQLRPRYVGTQAIFEQIMTQGLSSGSLKNVIAVIHTPLPATPLCTEGEATSDLVDLSILLDEKRLQTVRERSAVLRAFLQSGGVLMATYPGEARGQRSGAQLAIFDQLLMQYPQELFDVPLNCHELPPEMVGATYLLETAQGEWFIYSVRFTQATSPQDPTHAGMWFGSVQRGPAAVRLNRVSAYLRSCEGPDLMTYLCK
ncbi:MAG: hypothetical protein KGZ39_01225 [Simkania sp.]|nr:hypothetical protein [Simkania sp.]